MSRPRTWRAPLALAALTVVGLAGALLGDGAWDRASWIALAVPLAVIVRHACAR
jgi:hypothetical protein